MDKPIDVVGLTAARGTSLARVPLRTRGSAVTTSGWRLEVECAQGRGAIVLAEPWHRGEGLFLGWTQERLTQVYTALTARDEPHADVPQLG